MGLTMQSVGSGALDAGLSIQRQAPSDRVVAVAGNPNVGKSTVFNALTGMNQHTGNWPGKTVTNAQGVFCTAARRYILVDIPGTYSLMAHSQEEEIARDFLCFGAPDAVVVVCDATCLERNLNLVLQVLEITKRVIVCVNLMDEAERRRIRVDFETLSARLGVPVIGVTAQKRPTLAPLESALDALCAETSPSASVSESQPPVLYAPPIEAAVSFVSHALRTYLPASCGLSLRFVSLKLLEGDASLLRSLSDALGEDLLKVKRIAEAVARANELLAAHDLVADAFKDAVVASIVHYAEELAAAAVSCQSSRRAAFDRSMDRILTGRAAGYPVMLLLLALVFFLTISGANYPSALLSKALFTVQDWLSALFFRLNAPDWLHGALVLGVYRVLAWIVSVMLPPMAIFFPLFTLLEDIGYLPRVAYNLDKPFQRCHACGKQALTTCMVS